MHHSIIFRLHISSIILSVTISSNYALFWADTFYKIAMKNLYVTEPCSYSFKISTNLSKIPRSILPGSVWVRYCTPCAVLTITEISALNACFKPWLFIFIIERTNSWLLVPLMFKMSMVMSWFTNSLLWSGGIYRALTLKLRSTSVSASSGWASSSLARRSLDLWSFNTFSEMSRWDLV